MAKAQSVFYKQKPSISVKEARKILGSSSSDLSDTQVEEIIENLTLISRRYLTKVGSKNTLGNMTQKQKKDFE